MSCAIPLAALTAAAHVLKLAQPGDAAADQGARAWSSGRPSTWRASSATCSTSAASRWARSRSSASASTWPRRSGNVVNVWRASGRLERHHVSVEMKPAWVDADRARIEQVLSNLLDNAVKFTPAGRRIAVRVRPGGGMGACFA